MSSYTINSITRGQMIRKPNAGTLDTMSTYSTRSEAARDCWSTVKVACKDEE